MNDSKGWRVYRCRVFPPFGCHCLCRWWCWWRRRPWVYWWVDWWVDSWHHSVWARLGFRHSLKPKKLRQLWMGTVQQTILRWAIFICVQTRINRIAGSVRVHWSLPDGSQRSTLCRRWKSEWEYYFIIGYSRASDWLCPYSNHLCTWTIWRPKLYQRRCAFETILGDHVGISNAGQYGDGGLQWIGRELQVVGYGITGSNASDSGFKRTADMSIAEVYQEIIILEDFQEMQMSVLEILVVRTIQYGGDWKLVGINSSHMERVKKLKPVLYRSTSICRGFKVKALYTTVSTPVEPSSEPSSEPSAEPQRRQFEPSNEPSESWDRNPLQKQMVGKPFGWGEYDRSADESKAMACSSADNGGSGLWLLSLLALVPSRRR